MERLNRVQGLDAEKILADSRVAKFPEGSCNGFELITSLINHVDFNNEADVSEFDDALKPHGLMLETDDDGMYICKS